MRGVASLVAGGVALVMSASAALAAVNVTYVHPENYTDAYLRGGYGDKARAPALNGLREHLEKLGARYLKPDQVLTIDVLNLDLAGQLEPWHRFGHDTRYLREVTWPRMTMRYTLTQNGTTLAQGEETVSDMNYLLDASARVSSDELRYDKTMLTDWFRNRIVRALP